MPDHVHLRTAHGVFAAGGDDHRGEMHDVADAVAENRVPDRLGIANIATDMSHTVVRHLRCIGQIEGDHRPAPRPECGGQRLSQKAAPTGHQHRIAAH
jgi:hypothetical protein